MKNIFEKPLIEGTIIKRKSQFTMIVNIDGTEYKLLCLLARDVGKVLTHTYLTDKIWGSSWERDMALYWLSLP